MSEDTAHPVAPNGGAGGSPPTAFDTNREREQIRDTISLSSADVLDLVTRRAAAQVHDDLEKRADVKRRQMTLILSLASVIGIGTVVSAAGFFIKSAVITETANAVDRGLVMLEPKIQARVAERTAALKKEFEDKANLLALGIQAVFFDVKTKGFSKDEKDAALEVLSRLDITPELLANRQFAVFLEKIVDKFYAANLAETIDNIDDRFRIAATESSGLVHTLLDHYGLRIAGSAFPADRLSKEQERFRAYAVAARKHDLPERALLWELLTEFKATDRQRSGVIDELVANVQYLKPGDKEIFFQELGMYMSPDNWQRRPTEQGVRVGTIATALVGAYSDLQAGLDANSAPDDGGAPSLPDDISRFRPPGA